MRKKFGQLQFILVFILVIILCVFVVTMIVEVSGIQKYARVVNYSGIIRGATQRLVKNELLGTEDDAEIARLDDILIGLQTGKCNYDLVYLSDPSYQAILTELSKSWTNLKKTIIAYRDNEGVKDDLYQQSEAHFFIANSAVTAAEESLKGYSDFLLLLEILTLLDLLAILLILSFQIVTKVKSNRQLSLIAFIDPNTGMPNRRRCDEMLAQKIATADPRNICCLMLDLNNLKLTNDLLGHDVGDVLISNFAHLLQVNAPPNLFLGRYGGDEFIGIHMDTTEEVIQSFVDSVRTQAAKDFDASSKIHPQISFAYGYAFSKTNPAPTLRALMLIADKHMYENKVKMKAAQNKP